MSLHTEDDNEEAQAIAYFIKYLVEDQKLINYSDVAILYRLNAQSRPFEDAFTSLEIPYEGSFWFGRRYDSYPACPPRKNF